MVLGRTNLYLGGKGTVRRGVEVSGRSEAGMGLGAVKGCLIVSIAVVMMVAFLPSHGVLFKGPLLSAAKARASQVVACLVDHGAHFSTEDFQGRDVFGIATGNVDHRTIAVFRSRGLLPNGSRTSGYRSRVHSIGEKAS